MNTLYIGIGVTLILALVVALVGPVFVDWSSYRTVFETQASRVVGLPVTVIGDIEARLLPSPRVRFGDVVIGDVEHPIGRIGRFALDLETAPLLRGEFRVSALRLERPALDLALDRDGRLTMPKQTVERRDPPALTIDEIEVTDGRLSLSDARSGGRFELTRLAAVGSAASLAGPWKLDGAALRAGRDFSFHLGGGRAGDGATALKLQLNPADDPATFAADVVLREGPSGPTVAGKLSIERRAEAGEGDFAAILAGFRAEATVAGDARGLEASAVTLSLGPEERAAQLTGQGRMSFGAEPSLELALTARQVEADRLLRGESDRPVVPATVAARLLGPASGLGAFGVPTRLKLDLSGLVLGGGVVQDLSLEARLRPGGPAIDRFEARLPGRSRIEASGRIATTDGPRFDGRGSIASDQPSALAGWWRGEAVDDPLDRVQVSARVSATADRLTADDLVLEVGTTKARGHLDRGPDAVRLGLTADRLEADQVARLARLFLGTEATRRPTALDLDLDAGEMVLGGVTAKGVEIGVKVGASDVAVEKLAVADLAGARLSGSGHIVDPLGAPKGRLDLTVEAGKPAAAARALARFSGAEATTVERLASIAAAAAPLDLALHLEGAAAEAGAVLTGSLRGFAGGGELTADGRFDGRIDRPREAVTKLSAQYRNETPTAALAALLGGGKGRVALALDANGRADQGLAVSGSATVGDGSASLDGRLVAPAGASPHVEGKVAAKLADAAFLGGLVGRPSLAFERRLPVEVATAVAGDWPVLALSTLSAKVGDTRLGGALRLDLGRRPIGLDGRLDFDRLDVETAVETLLGGSFLGDGGEKDTIFATAPLGEAGFADLIAGTIEIAAERAPAGDLALGRTRAKLVVSGRETRVEGFEAGLAAGKLTGEAKLERRGDGSVALAGRLSLADATLEDLVWRRSGRAVATGRIGGEVRVTAVGRSAAALAAGLSGEGRLALRDARVIGVGGEALAATRVALGDQQPTDELVGRLFRARMEAAETVLGKVDVPFAVETGVARTGRMAVETANARLTGRLSVDLSRLTLDSDWSMEPAGEAVAATRTAISKATPSAGFGFRGPISAPERSFDVAPLVAHLTLAGFEREIDRVETLQQDIMERARFARERKRLEEMRAAEEAARKAAEEAAKAPKPAPPQPSPQPSGGRSDAVAPAPGPVAPAPSAPPAGATSQAPAAPRGATSSETPRSAATPAAPSSSGLGQGGATPSLLPPLPSPILVGPPPPVGTAPLTLLPSNPSEP